MLTSSRGMELVLHIAGRSPCSSSTRRRGTGSKALTMSSCPPVSLASSDAWRTASVAVSEPSVPTTIRLNTSPVSSFVGR